MPRVKRGTVRRANRKKLIHGLKALAVEMDRKMLAEMAVKDQLAFAELASRVKATQTGPQRVAAS